MKIAIFGATGRLGKPLLEKALANEYDVTALVRDPTRLTIRHKLLKVIQGDATNYAAVERAVDNVDVVISVMATSSSQKAAKTKPLTCATQNIIDAMKKGEIGRLIVSSCKTVPQPGDKPDLRFKLLKIIVKLLAPQSWADTVGFVRTVRASDLDWTMVRVGRGVDIPPTNYTVANYVDKKTTLGASQADVTDFVYSVLREKKYIQQAPVISSRQ